MKFHEAFNTPLRLLFSVGLYLPISRELIKNEILLKLSRLGRVFLVIAIPVYGIALALPAFMSDRHPRERLYSLTAGTAAANLTFKYYSFLHNTRRFEQLLRIWNDIMDTDFYPELREELLLKRKEATDRVIRISTILFISSMIMVFSSPFYTRVLEHPTVFNYSKESPNFEILVTYELVVRLGLVLVVNSYGCFLMQIVAFEDVLCHYLSQSLKKILTSLSVTKDGKIVFVEDSLAGEKGKPNSTDPQDLGVSQNNVLSYKEICAEAEKNLRVWTVLHQLSLRFNVVVQDIYGTAVCVELFSVLVTFCLVSFLLITYRIRIPNIANGALFCFNVFTFTYLTCSYGDLTQISSENIFCEGFAGSWFVYPRKIRSSLQIIIMRCKKSMKLVAFGLFPINSATFGKVLRHSYSVFMFLLQVVDRINVYHPK